MRSKLAYFPIVRPILGSLAEQRSSWAESHRPCERSAGRAYHHGLEVFSTRHFQPSATCLAAALEWAATHPAERQSITAAFANEIQTRHSDWESATVKMYRLSVIL